MSGRLRRHAGAGRPRRLERAVLATLAVLLALIVLASALSLRLKDELNFDSPRGVHFAYLLLLAVAVWLTLRWPRLNGALAMLALVEVALGVGARLVFGIPPLPDNASVAQRFRWHILLQATPVPSLALTTANDKTFRHTSQGTRGRELGPQELAGKNVVAVFGGSSTYDIGVSDEDAWTNRLEQAVGPGFAVVNHGVPGYSTVEHLIQTAFYQTKFGQPPACAVYYVGWNDIRNAHFRNLDPAYADFHLPSQVDSMRTRRVGGAHASISPLLTVLGQFVSALVDTVQYSWTLSGEIKSGSDPGLEALYARNVRAISAINRERRIKTVWIAQMLNRDRLAGSGGMYGWLPYVRDRDLWALQARFNEVLRETARGLDDPFVDAGVETFAADDFVDEGHFSPAGAIKFADRIAPAIREACR